MFTKLKFLISDKDLELCVTGTPIAAMVTIGP